MEKGLRFKHFEAHTDTEKRLVVARGMKWEVGRICVVCQKKV